MSAVSKAWKVIKPHVPLIQFKKGGGRTTTNHSTTNTTTATTITKSNSITMINDDTQLPARYQRKPITELEMQLIQTGGVPL